MTKEYRPSEVVNSEVAGSIRDGPTGGAATEPGVAAADADGVAAAGVGVAAAAGGTVAASGVGVGCDVRPDVALGVAEEADGVAEADGEADPSVVPPASVEADPQADSARTAARARQVDVVFLMDDPPVDAWSRSPVAARR